MGIMDYRPITDATLPERLADTALTQKITDQTSGKLDATTAATTYAAKSVETDKLDKTEAANTYALIGAAAGNAVTKWEPSTSYGAGAQVVSPDGDVVKAKAAFTSGATYDATKWDVPNGKYQRPDLTASSDYNTITTTGVYKQIAVMTDALAQNAPVAGFRGELKVMNLASTSCLQWATTWATNKPRIYMRAQASNAWGSWFEVGPDPAFTNTDQLTAGQDFDLLDVTGTQKKSWQLAAVPTDWVAQHMPVNVRGTVTVTPIGSSRLMEYLTWEAAPRHYARWKSGTFGAWNQIGAQAAAAAATAKPASGMKLVGVPITAGHSGSDAPLEATVRMPLLYQAPIIRWRLRIQDINPRSGVTRAGQINISGIWVGNHSGSGAMTSKVQLSGALTITDGATEYRTKWFNKPLNAGTEYLLSFGYTKATEPWAMLGHSYQTADDVNASEDSPGGMVKMGTAPFSIAIEAETYTHTPVIASLGDSNSVGVGATNVVHDSWLSQLCRRLKALPDHRGSSGDTCINSLTGTAYKYTRFDGLAKPDAVIMALGQNDAAVTDTTSADVIPNINTVLTNLAVVSDNVYAVNYMPRTSNPWPGFEAVRREISAHLLTQPNGVRDVFDIAAAISPDDETITAAYDADGTHLNTSGFAQVQAAVNRPVTTPPVQYVVV